MIKSRYWKTTWHYVKGHWETVTYKSSKYTKVNVGYTSTNYKTIYDKNGKLVMAKKQFNWNKPYDFLVGGMIAADGYIQMSISAKGPRGSNVNNDQAVRGRIMFDRRLDIVIEGWNAPWEVLVPY